MPRGRAAEVHLEGLADMRRDVLSRMFRTDLAIDLGTANVRVYVQDRGIVLSEPSVVAVQEGTEAVLAVGHEAKRMLGRTPHDIRAVQPLKDGVIADVAAAEKMLDHFLARAHGRRWGRPRPRVVTAVPSSITRVERRAVRDAVMAAGANEVCLVDQPTAAALGAGLPIHEPGAHVIVHVGAGTTEVAVLSLAGTVNCVSIRGAGNEMDERIVHFVKKHANLMIGEQSAERIKIGLGARDSNADDQRTMTVAGRDLLDGLPKAVNVEEEHLREALHEPLMTIARAVRACLEETPPELSGDIVERGIVMTGGTALLPGLAELLRAETSLTVRIADDPMSCVVTGVGMILGEDRLLKRVAVAA
jgi:rod shape-determining protein MreB and related proteins